MSTKHTNICNECNNEFVAEGHNAETIVFCNDCLADRIMKRKRELSGKYLDKEENE